MVAGLFWLINRNSARELQLLLDNVERGFASVSAFLDSMEFITKGSTRLYEYTCVDASGLLTMRPYLRIPAGAFFVYRAKAKHSHFAGSASLDSTLERVDEVDVKQLLYERDRAVFDTQFGKPVGADAPVRRARAIAARRAAPVKRGQFRGERAERAQSDGRKTTVRSIS